jgi:hypothetical protein
MRDWREGWPKGRVRLGYVASCLLWKGEVWEEFGDGRVTDGVAASLLRDVLLAIDVAV